MGKINKAVSFGGNGLLKYRGRLSVTIVDRLRNHILEEAHVSRYSIHSGSTKIYDDLREVFWLEGFSNDIKNSLQSVQIAHKLKSNPKTGVYFKKSKSLLVSGSTLIWILWYVCLRHKINMTPFGLMWIG